MSKKASDILLLQTAIQELHGCEAIHQKTVLVDEKFEGRTMWCGEVEVFQLIGHPKCLVCFAWFHLEEGKGPRPVALLDRWPIRSPHMAVKAAIALNIATPSMSGGSKP